MDTKLNAERIWHYFLHACWTLHSRTDIDHTLSSSYHALAKLVNRVAVLQYRHLDWSLNYGVEDTYVIESEGVGWIVFLRKICWYPNILYLWMLSYLETGLCRENQVKNTMKLHWIRVDAKFHDEYLY